jgi:hypothetical protein
MRRTIALLLMVLPLPALAGECDRWSASMEEDEGGSVMTARICAGTGNPNHEFFVRCGAPGELMIRFIPLAPDDYPPGGGDFQTDLKFSFGQDVIVKSAHYEDMDAAMVTDFSVSEPFANMLGSRAEMTLADVNAKVPGATFSLKGSKAALDKLMATCQKP